MHIFILGHCNDTDGQLSASSENRISLAISFVEKRKPSDPPVFLVATGGFGDNFNKSSTPHHVWVEKELRRRGHSSLVQSGNTLKSAHTLEDAILIKKYCQRHNVESFIVVTNAFHLARCQMVLDAIFSPLSVKAVVAANPVEINHSDFEHESNAIQRLKTQRGVYWRDEFFPLVTSPKGTRASAGC